MNLSEKIERLRIIPKKIVDLKLNRELGIHSSPQYDCIGSTRSINADNTEENNMIEFADDGEEIKRLIEEKDRLTAEVCQEIDKIIPDTSVDDLDRRSIMKSNLLKNMSLKAIANKVVHRDYKTVRAIFHETCDELKIYHSIPLNTACRNGNKGI